MKPEKTGEKLPTSLIELLCNVIESIVGNRTVARWIVVAVIAVGGVTTAILVPCFLASRGRTSAPGASPSIGVIAPPPASPPPSSPNVGSGPNTGVTPPGDTNGTQLPRSAQVGLPEVVEVPNTGFAIGTYEITNEQYREFVNETGHDQPGYWGNPDFDKPTQPVVGVSWHDAMAYCRWLSEQGRPTNGPDTYYSLPTGKQWDTAAGYTPEGGSLFPWERPLHEDKEQENIGRPSGKPLTVYRYTTDVTWCGACDMLGNVAEWCDEESVNGMEKLIRGGWWGGSVNVDARHEKPLYYLPDTRKANLGFRVVKLKRK